MHVRDGSSVSDKKQEERCFSSQTKSMFSSKKGTQKVLQHTSNLATHA
jgi:hypothetical protein